MKKVLKIKYGGHFEFGTCCLCTWAQKLEQHTKIIHTGLYPQYSKYSDKKGLGCFYTLRTIAPTELGIKVIITCPFGSCPGNVLGRGGTEEGFVIIDLYIVYVSRK